ncbi:MAG: hypothetical protein LBS85_07955 [Clostridiales Family XIII bacterium]|jgi:hypothetical protein|nr:hypothetical protein [Clostridiales Family XIII bacterium]
MALFEGFPFVSKEERARKQKETENRLFPFGLDAQRDAARHVLTELFPDLQIQESLFAFLDAKDAFVKNDKGAPGRQAALGRIKKIRRLDERKQTLLLRFIELESAAPSIEEYPTAAAVAGSLYPGETDD